MCPKAYVYSQVSDLDSNRLKYIYHAISHITCIIKCDYKFRGACVVIFYKKKSLAM